MKTNRKRKLSIPLGVFALTAGTLAAGFGTPAWANATSGAASSTTSKSVHNQHLRKWEPGQPGRIQHVIYVIMDNVHLSDIQQMPHLMDFIHHGTLFTNDHTVLDSHTQDGMLSDMTGQYPSQTGVVDQGFYSAGQYSSFEYWTSADHDGLAHVTTTPNWATFNAHDLSVGAVGTPDMELEKTSEVQSMNATDKNPSDYLGVAVHEANGNAVLGSPNLPYLYNAPSWEDANKTLGGFPGWGEVDPNWSLQATYEMQTHGVPVTFTYLSDVHESLSGDELGPGQYGATIQAYDQAFQRFFTKLNEAGINRSNTLFVFTTDEGDHYVPGGEDTTNLAAWMENNSIYDTPASNFNLIGDSGALIYLKDTSHVDDTLRSFTAIPGWNYIADPAEMKALHMYTENAPDRTPTFAVFAKPDVYYGYSGSTAWTKDTGYLWNHGTVSPDILDIWNAMVGPGVKAGHTSKQWMDHADTMPTVYTLLGYSLANAKFAGIPMLSGLDAHRGAHRNRLIHAENVFKQLNAPVGQFGLGTLTMSTEASVNAGNEVGEALDAKIEKLTAERDTAAAALQRDIIADVQGKAVSDKTLQGDVRAAEQVLNQVKPYLQSAE